MYLEQLKAIKKDLEKIAFCIYNNDLASYHTELINLYVYVYKANQEDKKYMFFVILSKLKLLISSNADVITETKTPKSRKIYIKTVVKILKELNDDIKVRIENNIS